MEIISVSKEPMWLIYLGAFLSILGLSGFTPFKFDGWSIFAIGLHVLLALGVLLLLRGSQRIGWRLSLEGNVLYYQKFSLYSSWKKRRSSEFSLATQKINSAKLEGASLRITYEPGRELKFNTNGLNSFSQKKLRDLMNELNQ
ncbi:hypothetical protein N9K89_04440 [Schleiferiaceae bacterium]|nr:hypothetical protein [Schleiferiaceae bacterium]